MECPSIFIMYKSLRMRTLILRTTASVVIKFELGNWQIMKNCGMPSLAGARRRLLPGITLNDRLNYSSGYSNEQSCG